VVERVGSDGLFPYMHGPGERSDADLDTIINHIQWRYTASSEPDPPVLVQAVDSSFSSLAHRTEGTAEAPSRTLLLANGGIGPAHILARTGGIVSCIEPTAEQADRGQAAVPEMTWLSKKLFDYIDVSPDNDACYVWLLPNFAPSYLLRELIVSWKYLVRDGGVLTIAAVSSPEPLTRWTGEDLVGSLDDAHQVYVNILPHECLRTSLEKAGLEVCRSSAAQLDGLRSAPSNYRLEVVQTVLNRKRYTKSGWPPDMTESQLDDAESLEALSVVLEHGLNRSDAGGEAQNVERANRSIALDVLAALHSNDGRRYRAYSEQLHQSLFVPESDETNFEVWWSLGSLFHKTGGYEYAVRCLDRACELRPDDYRPFLRRGYCLEALMRFSEAIESGNKASALLERADLDPQTRSQETAELCHALGHFYASASHIGRAEPDEADFSRGLTYMIKACGADNTGLDYVSCVGSMFSEREQYQPALFWFDWARGRLPTTQEDSRIQEVEFYRAVALLGAGSYEAAINVLETMEAWAAAAGDWDAKSHGVLYRAKARVASLGLRGFDSELLERLLSEVEEAPLSRYVVGGVRRDRTAFLEYMRGAAFLDEVAAGDSVGSGATEELLRLAVQHLKCAVEVSGARRSQVAIYCSDLNSEPIRLLQAGLTGLGVPYDTALISELRSHAIYSDSGVTVFVDDSPDTIHKNLSGILWTLGALSASKGGLILCDPQERFAEILGTDLKSWALSTIQETIESAAAIALFRTCLEHFAYFETQLGLAPIGGAPSRLAIQAGAVAFIRNQGGVGQ